jgi:hypothetical protein
MTKNSIIPATVISIIVLLILLTLITLMFLRQGAIDPQIGDFAKLLAGAIVAKFSTVVDYWLGSSIGSKQKDDYIHEDNIKT